LLECIDAVFGFGNVFANIGNFDTGNFDVDLLLGKLILVRVNLGIYRVDL
jgi:hypothetical protein